MGGRNEEEEGWYGRRVPLEVSLDLSSFRAE